MYPDFDTIENAEQRLRDVWAYWRADHIPLFVRDSDKLSHSLGTPGVIVDDTWSDAEITELYHEMREIGAVCAATMH